MRATRIEFKRLLQLSIPVMIAQLSQTFLGVVDVFMLGRLDKAWLAAGIVGNIWVWGTMIFGMGLVYGMDPVATQAVGRRDDRALMLCLQRSLLFSAIASLPIGLAWWYSGVIFALFSDNSLQVLSAETYLRSQIVGVPALMLLTTLRQYLQAKSIVRPVMWICIWANVANAFFNWVFVFGELGCPRMGLVGAGIATGSTRVFMLVAVIAVILKQRYYEADHVRMTKAVFSFAGHWEMLRHGIPVSLQYGLEVWAFQIATVMATRLGTVEVAAHGIVLQMASLSFMMPLGISIAAVTRIGNLVGARRYRRAQRTAWVAFGMGAGAMLISAFGFIVFRWEIASLFSTDSEVVLAAVSILPIAAAFQLFDGVQVVGGGILRGMGRTRPAASFNVIGYYVLALPIAYWMIEGLGMGLEAIWWGCCIGLGAVAVMCVLWIARFGPEALATEPTKSVD